MWKHVVRRLTCPRSMIIVFAFCLNQGTKFAKRPEANRLYATVFSSFLFVCGFLKQSDTIYMFTTGILTGIVGSGKCVEKKPRICANVFRAKGWIKEHLSILSASRASLHKFAVLYLVPIICRSQIKMRLIYTFQINKCLWHLCIKLLLTF